MAFSFARFNRRLLLFILAIGMAVFAALLAKLYLNRMESALMEKYLDRSEKVEIVVPREDMAEGEIVDIGNFAIRTINADIAPPDAISPGDVERADGQALKIAMPRGRPLLWSYLSSGATPSFSDMLGENQRALTIAVDELNSISGMVRPHDRIDLFFVDSEQQESFEGVGGSGGDKNSKIVVPLLQNVLVKATGNIVRRETAADGREYERNYSTLTLDLVPEEIGKVILAQEKGMLRAALKRPDQKNTTKYQVTRELDLRGGAGMYDAFGVRVYVGGKQGGVLSPVLQSVEQPRQKPVALDGALAAGDALPVSDVPVDAGAVN
ncbi:MAG: Flp pilus assembly protein CpaB [Zoogloeaceae bacterium]|jgi:pilus assembly protein CpaB|nr:Flp pilus assembly protein CpaB [Zoogloeaceae bacterium]